jgi:predicted sulfurtransferase
LKLLAVILTVAHDFKEVYSVKGGINEYSVAVDPSIPKY